jgi:cytochrome P450
LVQSPRLFSTCIRDEDTFVKGENFAIARGVFPGLSYAPLGSNHRTRMRQIYTRTMTPALVRGSGDRLDRIVNEELARVPRGRPVSFDEAASAMFFRFHRMALFGDDSNGDAGWWGEVISQLARSMGSESFLLPHVPSPFRNRVRARMLKRRQPTRMRVVRRLRRELAAVKTRDVHCFAKEMLDHDAELQQTCPGYDLVWEIFLNGAFASVTGLPQLKYALDYARNNPGEAERVATTTGELRASRQRDFVRETLRLRASYFPIFRDCIQDNTVDGFAFRAGDQVLGFPAQLHRHTEVFTDPDKFRPSRFEALAGSEKLRAAYFPFGLGGMSCAAGGYATELVGQLLGRILDRVTISGSGQLTVGAPAFLLVPTSPLVLRVDDREIAP